MTDAPTPAPHVAALCALRLGPDTLLSSRSADHEEVLQVSAERRRALLAWLITDPDIEADELWEITTLPGDRVVVVLYARRSDLRIVVDAPIVDGVLVSIADLIDGAARLERHAAHEAGLFVDEVAS
jgi:hypothetical protein